MGRLAARPLLLVAALLPSIPLAGSGFALGSFDFSPAALAQTSGVGTTIQSDALVLSADALHSDAYPSRPRFGVAVSAVQPLPGPSALTNVHVDADVPDGAIVALDVRGQIDGNWTEWREPGALEALGGASAIQVRLTLVASPSGASPAVRRVRGAAEPVNVRAYTADLTAGPPTVKLWATRIGLVGRPTANGHVIQERDRFVALPSKRALNPLGVATYQVQITYRGRSTVAPVWDVGPWNIKDDYWNAGREMFADLPRWLSQAEAAFFNGYNGGRDGFGRFITIPTSIDLADGTFWDDLGMGVNDWVEVTFLWVDAPSPAPHPTPVVVAKAQPPEPPAPSSQARAASYNAASGSSRVYLPLLMREASGWTTPWTMQNTGSTPVTGTMELYNADGNRVGVRPLSLPPFGSATVSPAEVPGVAPGFVGGAVLSASGPIAAVAVEDRAGSDRLAYEGIVGGSASVAVPLVFKQYNGWSTGIQVQNLGSAAATVRITYSGPTGGPAASESAVIAPLASRTFYQPTNGGLPSGFVGSASVESSNRQALGVLVNEVRADGAAMAYPGLFGGTDRLHVPLLFKRYNGWDTGLQVFNLGPASTEATLSYHGLPQPLSESAPVATNGSRTFYQPANPALPEGYVGSGTVTAGLGGRLVGIVNEVRSDQPVALNYVVGRPGATVVGGPLVLKGFDGWDSGVQVQNVGVAPNQVLVVFRDERGSAVYQVVETLGVGEARTYYTPAIAQIPPGFRGSVVVESLSGQPVAAIVNLTAHGQE